MLIICRTIMVYSRLTFKEVNPTPSINKGGRYPCIFSRIYANTPVYRREAATKIERGILTVRFCLMLPAIKRLTAAVILAEIQKEVVIGMEASPKKLGIPL